MRRLLLLSIPLLLSLFSAKAQITNPDYSMYSSSVVSTSHPGMLVRDYNQFYLDGKRLSWSDMYDILPSEEFRLYERYRNMYGASTWIAAGGVAAAITGGLLMAFSKSFPDKDIFKAGPYIAAGGAAAIFAVSIPLDIKALRGLGRISTGYNDKLHND